MSPLFFNKKSTLLFFILCAFPVKRMLYKGSMPATNHVTKVFYAYLIWGKQKGGENVTDFEKLLYHKAMKKTVFFQEIIQRIYEKAPRLLRQRNPNKI